MSADRKLMSGLHVVPLVKALKANKDLWKDITVRQQYEGSAHADTECIFIRGPAQLTPAAFFNQTDTINYPAQRILPEAMALVEDVCSHLNASRVGRVMIVKLKPSGKVREHVDEGRYADAFSRFHIVLQTNDWCINGTDGVANHWEEGELWWFNHKLPHRAANSGPTPRVHLIFDAVVDALSPRI